MSLMVSISGVRGIVGDSLTPEVVVMYTRAFGEFSRRGKIVLGRDGRLTGKGIGNIVSSTLLAMGCDVVALGVAPTPTIQIAVEQLHAAGGISITASHNPMEWNGLKFIGPSGTFLNGEEHRILCGLAAGGTSTYVAWDRLGRHTVDDSFLRQHDDMVLSLPILDIDKVRQREFKIVVDCINSSGGLIVPALLRRFGCEVVEMNCEVSGIFARPPEPIPENLTALARKVVEERADLGIAVDPDADRLVLITERGEPFGEEYTVTTVVNFILGRHNGRTGTPPSVVVNLSTTRAVDDVARAHGARVVRTPVGEINVVQRMKEIGAIVGGEGSGGVIVPAVHFGRDAIVGIGLILQQLAEFQGKVSEFKASLPQYAIEKAKVAIAGEHPDALLERLVRRYGGDGTVNTEDGLKIDFERSWVHLRKSNTEPIMRIIAEAPTAKEARELVERFREQLAHPG